jgi:hypothetical protein
VAGRRPGVVFPDFESGLQSEQSSNLAPFRKKITSDPIHNDPVLYQMLLRAVCRSQGAFILKLGLLFD